MAKGSRNPPSAGGCIKINIRRICSGMTLASAVFIISSFCTSAFAATSEEEYLKEIRRLADTGQKKELFRVCGNFFKEYPKSNLTADARLILADNEEDTQKAIGQFKAIVDNYKYFKKRDYARYRICEILYLEAKWNDLKIESAKGIESGGEYNLKFRFFLAKALIYLEEYDRAKEVCLEITKISHEYENLSEVLLLMSHINRKIYGFSRSYLYSLNEIITAFGNSGSMPAALYLLGRYYENRKEYDKAYSAYSDVAARFPKSPEAEFANRQMDSVSGFNPARTNYMPDKESIKALDGIDIEPETDEDPGASLEALYSISLGPFYNIKDAREIKALIEKDFPSVEIAQTHNGFAVYTGKFASTDSALRTKIRLAEEYGINGSIVKIIRDNKRLYIYEE